MNAHSRFPSIIKSSGRPRPGTSFERAVVASYLNAVRRGGVEYFLKTHYPDDNVAPLLVRAAVDPSSTVNSAALATEATADFIISLAPLSAGARLMQGGIRIDLQRNVEVTVPTKVVSAVEGGSFVAEGQPIPVIAPALTGAVLAPRKMGVIMVYTGELADRSVPSIESVIGTTLREASSLALDAAMFSTTAGDDARPAGLFHGLTPLTASAATPLADAMMEDVSALVGAVAAAGGGANVVLVAAPPQAVALKLRAGNAFDIPILPSNAMAAGSVAAFDTSALAFGFGGRPDIDTSMEATLVMRDDPVPISDDGDLGTPTRSLYQTDTVASRLILDVAWVRRANQVALVNSVAW